MVKPITQSKIYFSKTFTYMLTYILSIFYPKTWSKYKAQQSLTAMLDLMFEK